MKFFTLAFISLFFSVSSLFATVFTVDGSHTNVAFKVKHMMISTVNGEFQKFSGNFELDDETKALKALSGDIDVASINTNIDKRDEHLRSDEIFDAQKYPKITFVLDKVKGDKAYGKLIPNTINHTFLQSSNQQLIATVLLSRNILLAF